jgi:maltooligosyltrehalose trehalohydrolase
LLRLRHDTIVPRLPGVKAIEAKPIGEAAVAARWRLGDGAVLALATNFGEQPCSLDVPSGERLFASHAEALQGDRLAGRSTVAFLEPAA